MRRRQKDLKYTDLFFSFIIFSQHGRLPSSFTIDNCYALARHSINTAVGLLLIETLTQKVSVFQLWFTVQ